MGRTLTEAQQAKLDANEAAGRLCGGNSVSLGVCTARATRKVTVTMFTSAPEMHRVSVRELLMCKRHADQNPVGFEGRNFKIDMHEAL